MTPNKQKSDVWMTAELISSVSLVKCILVWLTVKVIIQNIPNTLLLQYTVLVYFVNY